MQFNFSHNTASLVSAFSPKGRKKGMFTQIQDSCLRGKHCFSLITALSLQIPGFRIITTPPTTTNFPALSLRAKMKIRKIQKKNLLKGMMQDDPCACTKMVQAAKRYK